MSREKQNNTPTNTPTQNQFTNSELKEWGKLAREMCDDCRKTIAQHCEDMCCEGVMKHSKELYKQGWCKQSEGCEFCGTTIYVKTVQHTMPLLAPITRADELRHELLNITGEIYLPLEAKFCPVCGAKMKGGAE